MNISNALITDSVEKLVRLLVFLFPVFFLVIKGWSNAIFLLLALLAFLSHIASPKIYLAGRDRKFWYPFCLLLLPFLSELMAQLARKSIYLQGLDSPSRFLCAAFLFSYFSQVGNLRDLLRKFSLGACFGCIAVFFEVILFPENFWGDRAATYFVDPNTLAIDTVILLTIAFFFRFEKSGNRRFEIFFLLVIISASYVLLASGSRTGWITALIVCEVYILIRLWKNPHKLLITNLALIFVLTLIWIFAEEVRGRVYELFYNIVDIELGKTSTSIGFRYNLFRLNAELLLHGPFFGYQDALIPSYEVLVGSLPWLDAETHNMMVKAGPHSEIVAQLLRKGFVLGVLSLAAIILLPMLVFIRGLRSGSEYIISFSGLGFSLVVGILVAAFSIEVLNLKMNAAFWAFFLCMSALVYAGECSKKIKL